jgi:integrase
MARTVRDARLESCAARQKLSSRGKPYFKTLDPGLHLGYRKPLRGAGKWVVRFYVGGQAYCTETIATADDLSGANDVDVLDFSQAQREARRRRDDRVHVAAGRGKPLTVAMAIERHLEGLEARGKNSTDTRIRAEKMILPALGHIEVATLTTDQIRAWFTALAAAPPRVRTATGSPQRYRRRAIGNEDEEDLVRRRRSTANRIGAILNAALSHAWREGLVGSDHAWRRVKLFENVASARVRYLTIAEAIRLINASEPAFRQLVRAALETGCRYGELARLRAEDFNADSGTVAIRRSKTGKSRHVAVTEEGFEFFSTLTVGRPGQDLMLQRASGRPWGPSNQIAAMAETCRRAGISPAANFHALRHTYASLAAMNGAPLLVIAKNLGHADTRMVEKHYGHLAQSYVADAIRAAAPRFGFAPEKKIAALGHGRG